MDDVPVSTAPVAPSNGGRVLLKQAALVLLFDTVIALLLWLQLHHEFTGLFVAAQLVGLSIFALSVLAEPIRRRHGWTHPLNLATIPVGGTAGLLLAAVLVTGKANTLLEVQWRPLATDLLAALVFGASISYFFLSRERLAEEQARAQKKALHQAFGDLQLAESNFKLLQSQMEPHFLFNTLSNVLSLIETRPTDASHMLANLTAYLRSTLQRARTGPTTLGDELELLRAYLEIHQVRMGKRLRFALEVAPDLRPLPLPPLLLQPAVENAIRWGLEMRPEGGELVVTAERQPEQLRLTVTDTGLDRSTDAAARVGLDNLRDRMRALYGEAGAMELRKNQPAGQVVVLTVPLAKDPLRFGR